MTTSGSAADHRIRSAVRWTPSPVNSAVEVIETPAALA